MDESDPVNGWPQRAPNLWDMMMMKAETEHELRWQWRGHSYSSRWEGSSYHHRDICWWTLITLYIQGKKGLPSSNQVTLIRSMFTVRLILIEMRILLGLNEKNKRFENKRQWKCLLWPFMRRERQRNREVNKGLIRDEILSCIGSSIFLTSCALSLNDDHLKKNQSWIFKLRSSQSITTIMITTL